MVKMAQGGTRLFDLALDLPRIEKMVKKLAAQGKIVKLIQIDPLNAYLGTGTNSFKPSDMRRLLTPISDFADRMNITIMVLAHLNKAVSSNTALNRVAESHVVGALCRSAWMVAPECKDGKETGRMLFMKGKNNMVDRRLQLNRAYQIEGVDVPLDNGKVFNHPRIIWREIVSTTADEAFSAEYAKGDKVDQAAAMLKGVLAEGPLSTTDVGKMAEERGIGWRTVEKAKKKLDVRSVRDGFGPGSRSKWRLPTEEEQKNVQAAKEHSDRLSKLAAANLAAANDDGEIDWATYKVGD
jgi:putative DNA primase/helicase